MDKLKDIKETRSILVGRCDHEIRVSYPFHWTQSVISKAKELNFNILDLKNENYVEEKFNSMIQIHNPFFVFCNGHGDEMGYSTQGHNNEVVISANKNDYLLKNKIVYVLSCNTAKCLGHIAFDKGCSYIGYDDDFLFVFMKVEEPSADIVAKPFMEASNEIALTILDGGTPRDAFEKSQKKFDELIAYWGERLVGIKETEVPLEVVEAILGALLNDKECQVCLSIE